MLEFLKNTAKTTSGTRIGKKKEQVTREEEADIDEPAEPILPPAKAANKKAPPPQPEVPKPLPPCEGPVIKTVSMKVIELGPGESFYHAESGTLFMGKA